MQHAGLARPEEPRTSADFPAHAKAETLAQLLVALAEKRPEVLDRLVGLLEVLVDTPTRAGPASDTAPGASTQPSELAAPSPLRLTDLVEIETVEVEKVDSETGNSETGNSETGNSGAAPAPAARPESPVQAVVETKHPRERPRGAVDAKAEQGVLSLLARFGSLGGARGGLAKSDPSVELVQAGLWDEDAREARSLARLARAQARRLRKVRRAVHESRALPDVDGVLNEACLTDWTADAAVLRNLAPKDLREAERWYGVLTKSLVEVADWLEENPSTQLGDGLTPRALHQRLQAVATAQKGVWCWIDGHLPALGVDARMACGVQHAVYRQLAERWTKAFRTKLVHMQLNERVTAKDRGAIEDLLGRFDLEQAPKATAAPSEPQRHAAESRPASRFDDVAEAFEAARRDFACERIVFTEAAEESAEDSAFKRPDEVHEFFAALRSIADARARGARNGTPLEADFRDRGFTMKPCAETTMKRHRRNYFINFEGGKICISHHVTLGSRNQNTCLSIHWWHDEERGRFVIGHCGKHLPNTLS